MKFGSAMDPMIEGAAPRGALLRTETRAAGEAEGLGPVAADADSVRADDALVLREREGVVEADRAEEANSRKLAPTEERMSLLSRTTMHSCDVVVLNVQPVVGLKPSMMVLPFTSKMVAPL